MKTIKYILFAIVGFVFLYQVYLHKTVVGYIYRQLISEPSDYQKPILYKDIKTMQEINGTYKLNCKYIPEVYEVGVGFKYEYLSTRFNKINPEPRDGYVIKTKMIIRDRKDEIIYTKTSKIRGYGANFGLGYYAMLSLEEFWLTECDGYTLEIDFIESDIGDVPEDLMYLYVRVNTTW